MSNQAGTQRRPRAVLPVVLPLVPVASLPCCAPVTEAPLSEVAASTMSAMFKALGDPVRLRLFSSIASERDEVCVCDIPDVGVSQPTVSHHLRKLREAGLLTSERRGTWVFYRAVPEALAAMAAMLAPAGG